MPFIRGLLNNGFWLILLAILAGLYVYYSGSNNSTPNINPASTPQNELNNGTSNTNAEQLPQETNTAKLEKPVTTDRVPTEAMGNVTDITQANPNHSETAVMTEEHLLSQTQSTTKLNNPIFPNNAEMEHILESESPPPAHSKPIPVETQTAKVLSPQQNLAQQTEKLLEQARDAVNHGNIQQAQTLYMQLLQIKPNANLLGEIANQLYRLGYQELAEFAWVEAFNFLLYEQRQEEAQQLSGQLMEIAPRSYKMIIQQYPSYRIQNTPDETDVQKDTHDQATPFAPYGYPQIYAYPAPPFSYGAPYLQRYGYGYPQPQQ
ncbi:hypothetical protein J3998_02340 [Thiomicrorhabdus sp. 6S2-11]|uniref:Tetratricopeptide repeat protein n=1 Tax=Thiomicrorhabdus marina TaxID=2818442 RepID=A0ABS3Q253_9GAMM|nr:hypothetical protein [Thiomicrorhabdus marina]MBO1926400.1 hypothetical protein [Thiomicrorhabdus marina]